MKGWYNIAWKCSGVDIGAVYPLSVPCEACESFGECPSYDVVSAGSILDISNLWAVSVVFTFVTAALWWWKSRKGKFIKK